MSAELVVNLWAIYDAGTGLIYGLSGRAYCAKGTEEEKLDLLHRLSANDYVTAKRYEVPDRFKVSCPDGTVRQGMTTLDGVMDPNDHLFEDFRDLETELPPLLDFSHGEGRALAQKLPADPLCVVTVLYEDESGNIRPIITDKDREWVAAQEKAHGREPMDMMIRRWKTS